MKHNKINCEKILLQIFYITYKNNQGLNQNFETRFPQGEYKEHVLSILLSFIIDQEMAVRKFDMKILKSCL